MTAPSAENPAELSAALDAVGGDLELLRIVVRATLDELPVQLERLAESCQNGDLDAVRAAAHAAKGAVRYYGETAAYDLAYRIERGAASMSTEEIRQLVNELCDQAARLLTVVRGALDEPDESR